MFAPIRRLFRLSRNHPVAPEVDEELDLHRDLAIEVLVRRGVPPADAARQVASRFGDRVQLRRDLARIDRGTRRSAGRRERFGKWLFDLRRAGRGLRRDGWASLAAALLIGLGLAANLSVFSIVNAAFFLRLAYPEPDRIVAVSETRGNHRMRVAEQNLLDWKRDGEDLGAVSGYADWDRALTIRDRASMVRVAMVDADFAKALGVAPMLGRWFSADESRRGGPPAVLIGERLWRTQFGGDPGAVGSTVRVDGVTATVIGVMPARLDFPVGTAVWAAAEQLFSEAPSRTGHNWSVVGRLAPGRTLAEANQSLGALTRRLVAEEPVGSREYLADGAAVVSLRTALLGESAVLLRLLQAAVALLLLIAAFNLTILLLARAAKRRDEAVMSLALGAGRNDLIRLSACESLWLTIGGASLGLALWLGGRPALLGAVSGFVPFVKALPFDGRLAGGMIVAVAVVGFGAAILPALWLARSIDRGGVGQVSARVVGPSRLMQALLAAEVAATFVLLFGAGALGRSLVKLLDQPLGFSVAGQVAVPINLPGGQASPFANPVRHVAFFDGLLEAIRRVPGVRRVSLTTAAPTVDGRPDGASKIRGEPSDGGEAISNEFSVVGPGFFTVLGIPIVAGRDFSDGDGLGTEYVAVVSEAFGRVHLGGQNPLGRQVSFPSMSASGDPWATIVGVVGDIRQDGPGSEVQPAVYYSYRQRPQLWRTNTVVATVSGPTQVALEGIAKVVAKEAPEVPFMGLPLEETFAGAVAGPRARAVVVWAFAGSALLLTAVGLFGVVGFMVDARTRELGLRIALGASSAAVARSAWRHVGWPAVVGIAIGVPSALAASGIFKALLYQVSTTDPLTLVGAGLTIGLAAFAASLGPVLRAVRIDPARTLRLD